MAEQLFIRLGGRPDEAETIVVNDDGHVVRRPETVSLAAAAELANMYPVTVMLPGEELVTTLANVPAASIARLRQMLPYSLEDELASDIDDLHFAAGARNDADRLPVSVIARERLEFWLDVLQTAGIRPRQICAETDAVADTPGAVTLFLEGRKLMGRRPGGAPFLFEDMSLPDLWRLLESEREDNSDLGAAVLMLDSETARERRQEIDQWRGELGNVDLKELPDGSLPRLAASLAFRPGPNLLQGRYAIRSNLRAMAEPWRVAAVFLIAFVGFSLLAEGAAYLKLRSDEQALDRQAIELCTQELGIQQLSRCRAEMQRRLNEAGQTVTGGSSGWLATLAAIAELGDQGLALERLDYRNQVMTLDVVATSVPHLDAFDQRLSETGRFAVDIQSTRPEDGAFRSRLQVMAAQ